MTKSNPTKSIIRQFFANSFLLVLVNLLIKPFWLFGVDRVVQNELPETYGLYYALFNLSFFFSVALDMGMTNLNSRELAADQGIYRKRFSLILSIKFLLFIGYSIITIGGAYILGYSSEALLLLVLLCLSQAISSLITFLRSNLRALGHYRLDSWLSGLDRLIMILLCAPMIWGSMTLDIKNFVLAQLIAYALVAIAVLFLVASKCGRPQISFSLSGKVNLLRKALPFAILGILMGMYVRLDTVMLERMLDDGVYEVGVYAEGYRLLDALQIFAVLISAMLLPMFSEMISSSREYKALRRSAAWLVIGSSIIVAGLCFLGSEYIVDFIYPGREDYNYRVFAWILLSFIPLAGIYVYGTFLTAAGELKYLNLIALIAVIMNLSLNFILIPRQAAFGSAIATLITQCFVFTAHLYLTLRKY